MPSWGPPSSTWAAEGLEVFSICLDSVRKGIPSRFRVIWETNNQPKQHSLDRSGDTKVPFEVIWKVPQMPLQKAEEVTSRSI